ncbi:Protein CASP [Taenia solium]|eukprot:TsM_000786000 transcript=TsM_000786000 gene=TsM_000786000
MLSIVNSTKSAWNELEFPKFQAEIGETASMIASVQERDRLSRKKLVEVLLQFRKSASEEVRKAAASVLKSFQTEVDRLTIRSQKAEDAFIQVYQRLAEMPDPSLALAEAESISKGAQRASDLKIENARLRETIEELKGELNVAKSRGACAAISYRLPLCYDSIIQ